MFFFAAGLLFALISLPEYMYVRIEKEKRGERESSLFWRDREPRQRKKKSLVLNARVVTLL